MFLLVFILEGELEVKMSIDYTGQQISDFSKIFKNFLIFKNWATEVAEWVEHSTSDPIIKGSNPAGDRQNEQFEISECFASESNRSCKLECNIIRG